MVETPRSPHATHPQNVGAAYTHVLAPVTAKCQSVTVPKLVDLTVEETSGVDQPAHLDPGWLVIKSEGAAVSEAAVEPITEPTVEELTARIEELTARIVELEALVEEPEPTDTVEELAKNAPEPLSKAFTDMRDRLEKAEAQLAVARDAEETAAAAEFVKSLNALALPDTATDLIKNLRTQAPELAAGVEATLLAVNGQTESGSLFKELGAPGTADTGDAYDKWNTLAKAKMDSGEAATIQQARSLVALENPALYTEMKG